MASSLYDFSIAPSIRYLNNVSAILKKGEDYADEKSIPHSQLLEARLAPNMGPLTYQIQRVSDSAKGLAVRIAGLSPVAMPDNETTFEELQSRIARTIELLQSVKRESLEGKANDEVIIATKDHEYKFTVTSYLTNFAMPNILFHVSTAYGLLRGQGVPLGKLDFLGDMDAKDSKGQP